jgi:hypothetical protein
MPVWGWIVLIAGLSGLLVAALAAVVRGAHKLPSHAPLRGDPEDIAAPLPIEVAEADGPLAREPEEEQPWTSPGEVSVSRRGESDPQTRRGREGPRRRSGRRARLLRPRASPARART